MSSKQLEVQKEMLFKSYTAIENIANIGQLYCCCQIFSCCETIQNFLRSIKRYCCYCQFADRYNRQYLNEIKRNIQRLKHTTMTFWEIVRFLRCTKMLTLLFRILTFLIRFPVLQI